MVRRPIVYVALALACAPAAHAQTTPSRLVPQTRPDQNPTPPRPHQAPPRKPVASAQAPDVTPFVLTAVSIEGSSLPSSVLEAAYRPFIGRTVDVAGLQQISDAIAAAYERSDVALYTVLIPNQDFAGGGLKLTALEGYVESIAIDGPPGRRNRALVEAYLEPLKDDRPVGRRDLQRQVSLVRDIPGLVSDVQLQSGTQPGAVQVAAKLDPKRVQVGLGVNNRGTAFLGRTQVQGDLYVNSLLRQGDQTRLTVAAPTETRLFQYYAIGHTQPLNAKGTTLQVNAGRLRTRPRDTDLLGHATSVGVQVSHPLIRSFDKDLYLTLGVDGLDSDNAFLGFTFSDDRTRAVRASLAFSRTDEKSLLAASGALSHGIDGLGARTSSPEASKLDFTKINGRISYNRSLARPLVLRLAATGQYSSDRLPGSEQLALGGEEFGRAFEAAYIAGDYGYAGSGEIAFQPVKSGRLAGSEVYAFVDGGKLWYKSRFGFPTANAKLSSAGGGVRVVVASRAIVQLEAVKGLQNPIGVLNRESWRGVFNIRTLF